MFLIHFIKLILTILLVTVTIVAAAEQQDDLITTADNKDNSIIESAAKNPQEIQSVSVKNSYGSVNEWDKTFKLEDLTDDLEDWEAPLYLKKAFPYYISGYDDEGRPVWIAEAGKYAAQFRKLDEQYGDDTLLKDLDMYMKQAAYRIKNSVHIARNETCLDVQDAVFILDGEGVTMFDIANPKMLAILLKAFIDYKDLMLRGLGYCICINVNYVAEVMVNMMRPIVGRAMEKVEIYGTNPAKWKAAFRKRLPLKAIPTWYGGSADFKPVQVYG